MEIRTVLCPVDFSGQTGPELSLATQVCQRFGARAVVEHNLDPRPPNFLTVTWMWSEEHEGEEEQKAGKAQEKLAALLAELAQTIECEAKLTRGPIDEVILLLVKELPADLLVMGSHGWSTAEHQSLTEKMIAKCPVPVLTVGNTSRDMDGLFASDRQTPARVLVTVDDDRKAQPAVIYAARLAASLGGELTLVEVLSPDVAHRSAERRAKARERLRRLLGDALGEDLQSTVVEGEEVTAVLLEAEEGRADLIVRQVHGGVMPWKKHGRQVDFDLLHRSPCPVLFVPTKYEAGKGLEGLRLEA